MKLDQWTAQDGSKRSKHSVSVENLTMLDSKATGESAAPSPQPHQAPTQEAYTPPPRRNMQDPPTDGGEYIDANGIRQTTQVPQMDESDEIPF